MLKKNNGGIADARNYGLRYAIGDYVLFVDQDDNINVEVIEHAVEIMFNNHVDAVFWSTEFNYNDGTRKMCDIVHKNCSVNKTVIQEKIVPDMLCGCDNEYTTYPGHIWGALFSRKLIEQKCIKLKKFVDYEDDLIFVFDFLMNSELVYFLKDVGYYWKTNYESYSHSRKYISDYLINTERLYNYFETSYCEISENILTDKVRNYFRQYTIIGAIKNACANGNNGIKDIVDIQQMVCKDKYRKAFLKENICLTDKREYLTFYLVKYKLVWLAILVAKFYYKIRRRK